MEVDTLANMTHSFLDSKGIHIGDIFDVTQELCFEDQVTMIFEKAKSQRNCRFWIQQ